jgi:hypothetical protein
VEVEFDVVNAESASVRAKRPDLICFSRAGRRAQGPPKAGWPSWETATAWDALAPNVFDGLRFAFSFDGMCWQTKCVFLQRNGQARRDRFPSRLRTPVIWLVPNFLKGIRAVINSRIEHLSNTGQRGTKIAVE